MICEESMRSFSEIKMALNFRAEKAVRRGRFAPIFLDSGVPLSAAKNALQNLKRRK